MLSAASAIAFAFAAAAVWAGERPLKGGEIRPALIYHNYCSVCHGDRGDGNSRAKASLVPPPRDFTTATSLTRDAIVAAVSNGRPGTAMVSWRSQLTSKEIDALADYLLDTFVGKRNAAAPPAADISGTLAHGGRMRDRPLAPVPPDMSLPMPGGLTGDVAKGERFYMGNCATCHGSKGDGQGPRAYFINPRPRNFIDPAARNRYNRPALYAAVAMGKIGSEMPAWKYVLTQQEIADVAEFVFRRFIDSAAATRARPAVR